MHVEIRVALNFLISFLYNKLPRRRVNQFGDELERALKKKFQDHWYPDRPCRGSGFRCLKTAPPLDPVFDSAAQSSGVDLRDLQEHLPEELCLWIDPGEVSYRLGEKGTVKVLYSDSERAHPSCSRTFNPAAQSFQPAESLASCLSAQLASSPPAKSPSPVSAVPLTFTTAAFAQTKFGSTKLKTAGKRSHRMSPTEFTHGARQRTGTQHQGSPPVFSASGRPRTMSPSPGLKPGFLLLTSGHQFGPMSGLPYSSGSMIDVGLGDLLSPVGVPSSHDQRPGGPRLPFGDTSDLEPVPFNLNAMSYPAHYRHLLAAN